MIEVTHRRRKIEGPKTKSSFTVPITSRLRGEVLYKARGSCSNCGRTIEKHDIVVVVVQKIPHELRGPIQADNLWAICEECNAVKMNYFESVDLACMQNVMRLKSVHMRLGETLKAFKGEKVSAQMMDVIANQDDWKKRVRELRYLGWKIDVSNSKPQNGPASSFYKLVKSAPWPDDPTGAIRKYERERRNRNRA